MVLKVKAGTPLSLTPFFDLLGFKVMASWPGSEKARPCCKTVGHDSHTCLHLPVAKKPKKHTPTSKPPTSTANSQKSPLPTSLLSADLVTVDTADMDEDSLISDPNSLPFQLTPEQVQQL